MSKTWKLQPWEWLGQLPDHHLTKSPTALEPDILKIFERQKSDILYFTLGIVALALTWLWLFVSLYWDLTEMQGSIFEDWFAPAGAMLTFSGLFLQLRIAVIVDWRQTKAEGQFLNHIDANHQRFLLTLGRFKLAATVSVFAGTLVWAYGDKFVIWLNG